MALYCIHAIDGSDGAEIRPRLIGAHLAHVEANIDRYFVAGPLKNAAGQTIGSMLVRPQVEGRHSMALFVI